MVLSAATAFGQSDRGVVTGRIIDKAGAVIKNASVTLTNDATGVSLTAKPNESGDYQFNLLNPGTYTLAVSSAGFGKVIRTLVVDVGQTNNQDVTLNVGSANEAVTVSTGYQMLSPDSATLGLVVEQRTIQDLPLIYGNPFELEILAAGVIPSGVNTGAHVYDSSTTSVSVNGSVLNSLEIKLDGAPDNRIRYSAYTPATEFINQYKIETLSYDATQGHSSGGFENVSLKTGTNSFHGAAFGYYENPEINANTWSLTGNSAKPDFVRYGGTLGGPIVKSKLFFFTGFERSRQGSPNVMLLAVPTLAERGLSSNGQPLGYLDFSEQYALDPTHPPGTTNKYQLYDPLVAKTVGTNTEVFRTSAFVGNQIPLSRLSPIAANVINYYPLPNLPQVTPGIGQYAYASKEPNYYYAYIVRADSTITKKQQLYGHWLQSDYLQKNKNNFFGIAYATNIQYRNKGAALGYTYAITPATLIDAHLTWTRFLSDITLASDGLVNGQTLGLPAYTVQGLGPLANAFPRFDLNGFQSLDQQAGSSLHDDVSLASVQVSHLVGPHFLRLGYEYRMYNTNGNLQTQQNGQYGASGRYLTPNSASGAPSTGGSSLAQFDLGILDTAAQTQNANSAIRSNYMAGYVQDDWKALPSLVLNVGLRYEYEGPETERNNKANTIFDFGATNPYAAAAQAAYVPIASKNANLLPASQFSVNGGLRFATGPIYSAQKINLLPRVGLSFQLNPQTVIRAGYGVFFDSLLSFYESNANNNSTPVPVIPQQGFSSQTSVLGSGDLGLTFQAPLSNPFPNGYTPVSGSSLGLATGTGANVFYQPADPKNPYNQRWSLGLQRQFGSWLAEVGYVGNRGEHLPVNTEHNALPAQYMSTFTGGYDYSAYQRIGVSVPNPFSKILPATTALGSATTATVAQLLKPYPEFSAITSYEDVGSSSYSSFQASLVRRFTNGFNFTGAFTWSKTLDATAYLNASDVKPWYGISANDRTFRFATSAIYELPVGSGKRFLNRKGLLAAVAGGWQVQGFYQVQSGAPLTFASAGSSLTNIQGNSSPLYLGAGSPGNANWGRAAYKRSIPSAGGPGLWFNTANFVKSTTYTVVTGQPLPNPASTVPNAYQLRTFPLRFDNLRSDFLNQANVSVQRNVLIHEPITLQIRVSAINAFNHPVYSAPVTDYTNSQFGQITAQGNVPRVFQFSGYLRF